MAVEMSLAVFQTDTGDRAPALPYRWKFMTTSAFRPNVNAMPATEDSAIS